MFFISRFHYFTLLKQQKVSKCFWFQLNVENHWCYFYWVRLKKRILDLNVFIHYYYNPTFFSTLMTIILKHKLFFSGWSLVCLNKNTKLFSIFHLKIAFNLKRQRRNFEVFVDKWKYCDYLNVSNSFSYFFLIWP